jgi:hypothetical protein
VNTTAAGAPQTSTALGGVITVEKYGSEASAPYTGVTLAMITDGTSKTFMIAESREVTEAAWIDGTRAWVTALRDATATSYSAGTWTGGTPAILDNQGTTPNYTGYSGNAVYGESSNHQAGITLFGYADGHVVKVTPEINTGLMLNLHTRAGSEPTADQP